MKKNMGIADRIIRLLIAGVFGWLYFSGTVTGVAGIIILVLGGVFILTSLVAACPLYNLLGVNTCSTRKIKAN